jgi:CRISPR-associated protein Cmr4
MSKNRLNYGDARLYLIHALTSLHVGSGRGTGFIDLPIMREKTTGWPIIPGSSVKGVWLDYYSAMPGADTSKIRVAFGREENDPEDEHAGSLAITDARIILFPVRSFYGTFAYATSPLVLTRLVRDLEAAGIASPVDGVPEVKSEEGVLVTGDSALKLKEKGKDLVFFEDLDLTVEQEGEEQVEKWAVYFSRILFDEHYANLLKRRFAVVPDSTFDYLSQQGTEINTRIRIDSETKVVARNALWNEEYLPAETVLGGIVWCDQVYSSDELTPSNLLNVFCKDPIICQMGGKKTIGKGRVRCLFVGGENKDGN